MLTVIIADIFFFSDSIEYATKKVFLLSNRALLIISLGICLVLILFLKRIGKVSISYKQVVLALGLASILLFIFQLIIVLNMFFYSGWDAGGVRDSVFEIINETYNIWYPYSRFPSNINITALMVVVAKISNFIGLNEYIGILTVNILLVNLAGFFTFLCAYKLTSSIKHSIFSWIMFTLLVSVSPWISIPYSDTYSILFPILAYYLYISMKPKAKIDSRWFFIGLLCFYGATIKQTVIIVLIAIIIVELLRTIVQTDNHKWARLLGIVVIVFLSVFPVLLISSFSKGLLGVEINNEEDFSIFHLAMMGLNEDTNGVFSQDDIDFSASFKTIEERNTNNIEVIKQRLRDFGFFGYLKFLAKKILVVFSDGSFAWGVEGNFYQTIPERFSQLSSTLKAIYYNDGANNLLLITIEQILWFVVLLFLTAMGILTKKPGGNKIVLMLIIIGIVSALMLFEARARYLYHLSSFFVLGASIGLHLITEKTIKSRGILNRALFGERKQSTEQTNGNIGIDASKNAVPPTAEVSDRDGKMRFVDIRSIADIGSGTPPIVDMSAYEVQNNIFLPLIVR